MKPLRGVVIETGATTTVRLNSGARLDIPGRRDLRLGDICFVLFDYTRLEIRDVWTEEEYYAQEECSGDESELPLLPEFGEDPESIHYETYGDWVFL